LAEKGAKIQLNRFFVFHQSITLSSLGFNPFQRVFAFSLEINFRLISRLNRSHYRSPLAEPKGSRAIDSKPADCNGLAQSSASSGSLGLARRRSANVLQNLEMVSYGEVCCPNSCMTICCCCQICCTRAAIANPPARIAAKVGDATGTHPESRNSPKLTAPKTPSSKTATAIASGNPEKAYSLLSRLKTKGVEGMKN
jgi:hypothetical protein